MSGQAFYYSFMQRSLLQFFIYRYVIAYLSIAVKTVLTKSLNHNLPFEMSFITSFAMMNIFYNFKTLASR